ncbi:MAG: RloB family protein [Propionibacteriaceae bacterium]|jgi:hypothetical protein|nr:RloB family protein [Propionibacteriaceae bacterium]
MGRSPTGGGRRVPEQSPQRRRYLIVCEGAKEVAYFKWLSSQLGGKVRLDAVSDHSDPERVLALALSRREADRRAARAAKDSKDVYNDVWIVVDVDQHAHLEKALAEAERQNVKSAVSVPCFEVWLILHLDDRRAAFASPQAVKAHWAKLIGPVTQAQEFDRLSAHQATAVSSARALLDRHRGDGVPRTRRNPSTEVGQLVTAIADGSSLPTRN